jgi:hypothetical protein
MRSHLRSIDRPHVATLQRWNVVPSRLSQTEQELEGKKATMASLAKKAALSTLTLTIRKAAPPEPVNGACMTCV